MRELFPPTLNQPPAAGAEAPAAPTSAETAAAGAAVAASAATPDDTDEVPAPGQAVAAEFPEAPRAQIKSPANASAATAAESPEAPRAQLESPAPASAAAAAKFHRGGNATGCGKRSSGACPRGPDVAA